MKIPVTCDACGKKYKVDAMYAGKRARCKVCGGAMVVPVPAEPTSVETPGAILRHEARERSPQPAMADPASVELIADHIEKHIGKIDGVYHELVSDLVHVDINHVPPTADRPYHTFVTSGMSDQPMHLPAEAVESGCSQYAEVMLCLPADWRTSDKDFEDESWYWPIHWLKILARLPHEYSTWLGVGHTVPNGDPAEPFAPNTRLCCVVLLPPLKPGPEFRRLKTPDGRSIEFLGVVPMYPEEVDFKLKFGAELLLERFNLGEVSELLDVKRANVCEMGAG